MTAPLRLGLYGCGARTNALIDSVSGSGLVKVTCCYDIDKNRREETAKKHNASAVDTSAKLIGNKDVDAFIISLAPKFHAPAAMETAQAGKPIFLEKPIATNLEDGRKLLEKMREKGIICQVGLAYRYLPVFMKVTDLIKSGAVGKVIAIQYDWISWIGILYEHIYDGRNWRGDPETGGQIVYHVCHLFDILRVWNGEILSVTSVSNHLIFPGSLTDNENFIILEHENGALSCVHFSEVCKHSTGLGRVNGSELTLEFEWQDNSWIKIYREARRHGPRTPDEVLEGFDANVLNNEIIRDFVMAAKGEEPLKVTVEDGFVALKVAFAAKKSVKEGRKVYLSEL